VGGVGAGGGSFVATPGVSIDPALFKAPYVATLGTTAEHGWVLLISANDALYSADVTEIYNRADARPSVLELRAVPAPRVPILSLAVVDSDGGTPWAHGYALSRSELFEWVAETPEHWRVAPVVVPPGPALEVWSNGDRARLGYADGTVISLPGLKHLAEPLAFPVEDYLEYRRHPFAVTRDALWRLDAATDGGETGTWLKISALDAGLSAAGQTDLRGARLYVADDALYLFTAVGVGVRIR
jgi:hypothetical protein